MPAPLIPIIMLAARIGGKKAIQSAIKRVSKGRAAQLVREGKARYAKEVEGSLGDALTKAAGPQKINLTSRAARRAAEAARAKKAKTKSVSSTRKPPKTLPARPRVNTTPKTKPSSGSKPPPAKTLPARPRVNTTPKAKSTAQTRLKKVVSKSPAPVTKAKPTSQRTNEAKRRLDRVTGKPSTAESRLKRAIKGSSPAAIKKSKRKGTSGLKEAAIAGTVVAGGAALVGGDSTKSVTVKGGDTLSEIARDNNTTIAAIKKANPNITNIHAIRPGQKIKVPKVKGRTSVYQGLSTKELRGKTKPTAAAIAKRKKKNNPMGIGPDDVKRASGGKVRKYKEGHMIGGSSRGGASHVLPRISSPPKPKGVGAATKGWGKTGSH